jgi:hypothetical protein
MPYTTYHKGIQYIYHIKGVIYIYTHLRDSAEEGENRAGGDGDYVSACKIVSDVILFDYIVYGYSR